jgi:hypothetical protein
MRTTTVLISVATLLLTTSGAAAQDFVVAYGPDGAQGGEVRVMRGPGRRPEVGLIAIEPFDAAPAVKDAPYTAEAITETTQVLADGNRIEQRTSATVARDSSGRIRRQQQGVMFGGLVAKSPGPLVTIFDPAGTHLTLDPERRVAYKMKAPELPRDIEERRRAVAENRAEPGDNVRFSVRTGPPLPGLPPPDERPFMVDRPVGPGIGPIPGHPQPPGTDVRTEQLEPREIEGVRAEGTRTTLTIEANTIGNQLPIAIVSERWYSPELQVVVLTRRSDPRFGETVYRLINIARGEPSPDLFEVPSDYRIEDEMPARLHRVKPPLN